MTDQLRVRRRKIANVLAGEPWIYPNAVLTAPNTGGTYAVVTEDEQHIGWADVNPDAGIVGRLLTRAETEPGIETFMAERLQSALQRRLLLGQPVGAGGTRIVNGEGDGLPGLVIDLFGSILVVDFFTKAMRERRDLIEQLLQALLADTTRVYRMSNDAAKREGCDPIEPSRTTASFGEHGLLYEFPLNTTQKTGFYLDQRDNRHLIGTHATGRRVLDLFCYHGGFALNAAANGAAQVVAVDSSSSALDIAAANAVRNGCNEIEFYRSDCFDFLNENKLEAQFDLIICDPPKLAPTKRDRAKGMNAYRYLIDKCLTALAPGGILQVASCSQAIQHEDLRYLLAQTAMKQGRELDCISMTGQPEDHPWPISFTTGRYLSAITVMDRNSLGVGH
jgi:23S rRNA (cytosine1962-C5)-methyltransferase